MTDLTSSGIEFQTSHADSNIFNPYTEQNGILLFFIVSCFYIAAPLPSNEDVDRFNGGNSILAGWF